MIWMLLACAGADPDADTVGSCDDAGDSASFVISTLEFSEALDDGSAWGFNLDGAVTELGDPTGCGKPDLVDPEGNPGIDNAFVGLMPVIENTEAAAVRGLLQDAVDAGELLIMVEITGLDDRVNDDCVTVTVSPAVGTPMVNTDGEMLDSQSFARDPEGEPAVVHDAALVDGRVVAMGLPISLSLQILDAQIALSIPNGAIQIDLDPDGHGATGHFGGGFSVDYLMEVVDANAIDDTLTETLRSVLPVMADLDGEAGECAYMSVDFEYEAIPAFFYAE